MPRMFDMLHGGWNFDEPHKPGGVPPGDGDDVSFPKKILQNSPSQDEGKKQEDHLETSKRLLSAVKKQGVDNEAKAQALYEETLTVVKTILEKIQNKEPINEYFVTISGSLDNLFNQLVMGESILDHVYKKIEPEYYLPHHIVNMIILSLFLGMKLGLNKSKMRELGLAAMFADVGLDKFRDIVEKPAKLSDEEYNLIKTHIDVSLGVIEKCDRIGKYVREAIMTHHERVDGSGYPEGLKAGKISVYAKIIGLVDTYEALSHRRAYREGTNAHKTIKLLLSSLKSAFDHEAMKLLLNSMSIYPIGTIVELGTGEIARVIGVKPGSPLRPIVMVVQDHDGEPPAETKIIDLSQGDAPSIVSSL
ncbi:MAG: HD domain-containing protein [Candidatus Omnitrophica bacterium]|nr:HD domain-containing protein [Candidatus Omnitrophota bacterium]